MAILQLTFGSTGTVGTAPRIVTLYSNDTLSTITIANYIKSGPGALYGIQPTDIVATYYSPTPTTLAFAWLQPTFSGNNVTLSTIPNPGDVIFPVTNGNIAIFSGTSGQIEDGEISMSNLMTLNGGNVMQGGGFVIFGKTNGTEASNAVTVNGVAGVITTSSLTTAGSSSYAITWTNSSITSTSVVLLTIAGGTNTTENITLKVIPGSGTATLTIYNNTASTALNGTIFISYLVM